LLRVEFEHRWGQATGILYHKIIDKKFSCYLWSRKGEKIKRGEPKNAWGHETARLIKREVENLK